MQIVSKRRIPRPVAGLALGLGLAGLVGACNKAPNNASTGEGKKPVAESKGDACTELSAKLCAEAGESSHSCASGKATLPLLDPEACKVALANIDTTRKKLKEQQGTCDELMARLCKDIGPDTDSCNLVKEKVPGMPPEQCQQMLGDYDQVLAQLKSIEKSNAPLDAEEQAVIATKGAPEFGVADAKVTIVEFSDFQCPYCSQAAEVTNQVKEKYGKQVRFIFRQFPLDFHKDAHLAAQAALAAADQGKFWEYHDLLFANQKALTRDDLEKYATKSKLDLAKFRKALDEGTYKKQVDNDLALGQKVAVSGTPTMFVNGKRVPNPTNFESLAKIIDENLKTVD
jgi:protein-disulfide isomerase